MKCQQTGKKEKLCTLKQIKNLFKEPLKLYTQLATQLQM